MVGRPVALQLGGQGKILPAGKGGGADGGDALDAEGAGHGDADAQEAIGIGIEAPGLSELGHHAPHGGQRAVGARLVDGSGSAGADAAGEIGQHPHQHLMVELQPDGIGAVGIDGKRRRGLAAAGPARGRRLQYAGLLELGHDIGDGLGGKRGEARDLGPRQGAVQAYGLDDDAAVMRSRLLEIGARDRGGLAHG
jgi:hypothetical protein